MAEDRAPVAGQPPPADRGDRPSVVAHVVRRGIPLLLLVGVLAGAYYYWQSTTRGEPQPQHAAEPQGPVPVGVVTVQPETVPIRMRFLGQTEGAQRVEIRARVAGYLQERFFEEGGRVETKQKLFQIDPRPFQVELTQAKARLESAEARAEQARLQLKRLRDLKGAVSSSELEAAQAQERVAAADIGQQNALIAGAELQLGYTTIESPIDGVIGQSLKDTGSYVDAGANGLLAVVQQVDPMYVRYAVTEQEVLRFRRQVEAGTLAAPPIDQVELEITLSDGSVYPHRGRINFVDVQVDVTTGTSVIRGQVPNPDQRLVPGQFIHATLLGIRRVGVIRVPQRAVIQAPTGPSVYVVNDRNVVEVRPVGLGEWSGGDHWIVERGLNPGDRVVVDRLLMVRPGVPVTPVPPAGPPNGSAGGAPPAPTPDGPGK